MAFEHCQCHSNVSFDYLIDESSVPILIEKYPRKLLEMVPDRTLSLIEMCSILYSNYILNINYKIRIWLD